MKTPLHKNLGLISVGLIFLLSGLVGCGSPNTSSEDNAASQGDSAMNSPTFGKSLAGLELLEGEADMARNFYFIIDGSGSMKGTPDAPCEPGRFDSKLAGAQWAVRTFLEKVPDDVNIGLHLFDQRGNREVVPIGNNNRQEFLAAVETIDPGSGTPLAEAIQVGTNKLVEQYKKQLGYGEYRLVVVTDGKAKGIPIAANLAAEWGMPIYAIGLCIDEDHPLRQHALTYRAADSFEDLEKGLEETLAELPSFDASTFDAADLDTGTDTAGGE